VPAESLQRLFSLAGATGGYCAKRGEPAVTCKHFHSCKVSRVQSKAHTTRWQSRWRRGNQAGIAERRWRPDRDYAKTGLAVHCL
jgi:hypothetical protein